MAPAVYARDCVENVLGLQLVAGREHSMTLVRDARRMFASCKLAVNDCSQHLPPFKLRAMEYQAPYSQP